MTQGRKALREGRGAGEKKKSRRGRVLGELAARDGWESLGFWLSCAKRVRGAMGGYGKGSFGGKEGVGGPGRWRGYFWVFSKYTPLDIDNFEKSLYNKIIGALPEREDGKASGAVSAHRLGLGF